MSRMIQDYSLVVSVPFHLCLKSYQESVFLVPGLPKAFSDLLCFAGVSGPGPHGIFGYFGASSNKTIFSV